MIRVRFIDRYNAWFPGADVQLHEAQAATLIEGGYCELYDKPAAAVVSPTASAVAPEPSKPEPVVVTDELPDINSDDSENDGGQPVARNAPASEKPTRHRKR